MRISILVTIPERAEAESYIRGFIGGLESFYPIHVQEAHFTKIPRYLKDRSEGATFSERGGKTYMKRDCNEHDHQELEVRVLEVTPTLSHGPDVSEQVSAMFSVGSPKVYEA